MVLFHCHLISPTCSSIPFPRGTYCTQHSAKSNITVRVIYAYIRTLFSQFPVNIKRKAEFSPLLVIFLMTFQMTGDQKSDACSIKQIPGRVKLTAFLCFSFSFPPHVWSELSCVLTITGKCLRFFFYVFLCPFITFPLICFHAFCKTTSTC